MRVLASAAVIAVFAGGAGAAAQTLRCGGDYTVAPGDTLAVIARKHYGADKRGYLRIYARNRAVIGPSPNSIEVGQTFFIPCPDARAASADPAAPESPAAGPGVDQQADPKADPAPTPTPADGEPAIRLATGPESAPLASLIAAALTRAEPAQSFEIVARDDRAPRPGDLQAGGFDLGFPWIRPDCDRSDALSPALRARCGQLAWSAPLRKATIAYVTGAHGDYAAAKTHAALFGARICRPRAMFAGDLQAAGLVEPTISLVASDSLDYCIRALRIGEVDVVSAEREALAREVERQGAGRAVVALGALETVQTLRAAGPRGRRKTRRAIALIDQGLKELRNGGDLAEAAPAPDH